MQHRKSGINVKRGNKFKAFRLSTRGKESHFPATNYRERKESFDIWQPGAVADAGAYPVLTWS